ncbi:MAG: hypothetical protein HOH95_08175 [Dehalococcoidia bacterium]|jgi:hypothetical protein|nr:hypothetical protein [Dehalococcoidia bacterium]
MRRALPTSAARLAALLLLPLLLLLTACNSAPAATPTPTASATASPSTPTPTAQPTPAVTPTPAPTPPPELDPLPEPQAPITELQDTLDRLLAGNVAGGEYAFAVTDLQTGESVGIGLDRPHYTGCVSNFFVILQATVDVQNGRYDEAEVGDLISRTIFSSNPVTARDLYRIVGDGDIIAGVQRVADLVAVLEMGDTVLDHPPGYQQHSLGVDRNNWSTVVDTNRALTALYSGDLLTEQWRDYLLAKMAEVKPGLNYLTGYGPDEPNALVSHKNGFFPTNAGWYVDNDIGIVRFERDGEQLAYAISFFSQRVPTKYDDIPFAQRLTTATWAFFQERYPAPEPPPSSATSDD